MVKIAYLVTCYPAASHSFIRREIAAIEQAGGVVSRFSVRPGDLSALPDVSDQTEFDKTKVILDQPWTRLIAFATLRCLMSPLKFWQVLRTAFISCSFRPGEIVRRLAYIAEASWLFDQLSKNRIQHLHAHFGTNSTMVARLAYKFGGPPYSFTVHGPDEFDRPIELDLRGKVADCAFCVAISSFGRSQLMRWSKVSDWQKIAIVRCGVDEEFIVNQICTPIPVKSNVCCVARLSGQKGIPLLIEAAARLKNEGLEFSLTLVGGGEMHDEIVAMIGNDGLSKHIYLAGWADSETVRQHILAARAMVLPSFAEGLPVAIMEALALERPVIVSAIAGTPELVDEECGWLIPSGSVDALADALRDVFEASPEKLQSMGSVGRQRVSALHNSSMNGAQLFQLFEKNSKERK